MTENSLLDQILQPGALRPRFQPVFDVTGPPQAHYLEGLVQGPQGTNLETADVLFGYVRRKHAEPAVDRACVRALLAASHAYPELPLGLNVHASTLGIDLEFIEFLEIELARHLISPARLVIEIVEHAAPWNIQTFREALATLKAIGVRIALDDVGRGYSNYQMVVECRPDYFKIDAYFVNGAYGDPSRRAVLRSIKCLADEFAAQAVAEGIETADDLLAVREAGIRLGQGWFLSPPRQPAGVPGEGR